MDHPVLYFETYLQLHQVLVEQHKRCQIFVPDIVDGGDIPQYERRLQRPNSHQNVAWLRLNTH